MVFQETVFLTSLCPKVCSFCLVTGAGERAPLSNTDPVRVWAGDGSGSHLATMDSMDIKTETRLVIGHKTKTGLFGTAKCFENHL